MRARTLLAALRPLGLFAGLCPFDAAVGAEILKPGETVEGTLDPSAPTDYEVSLATGQFAQIEVAQIGLDVELEVIGPGGASLATVDQSPVRESMETFAWIATMPGPHRITLKARRSPPAGRFRLLLEPVRAAGPDDRLLLEAQESFEEGARARKSQAPESRARAADAFARAAGQWERAGAPRKQARALIAAGMSGSLEVPVAVETCEAALVIAQDTSDVAQEAAALTCLAEALYPLGRYEEMLESQQNALEAAVSSGNRFLESEALQNLAVIHAGNLEADLSRARYEEALGLARAIGDDLVLGMALAGLAAVLNEAGEYQQALDLLAEGFETHRKAGNLAAQCNALINISFALQSLGDYDEAHAAAQEVIRLARLSGTPMNEAYGLMRLSALAMDRGDARTSVTRAREAVEIARRGHAPREEARILDTLALAHFKAGDFPDALQAVSSSIALSRSMGHPPTAQSLLNLCRVHDAMGDPSRAAVSCAEALETIRSVGPQRFEPMAAYLLARLERRQGKRAQARTRIEEALSLLEGTRGALHRRDWRESFIGSHREIDDFYVDLMIETAIADGGPARGGEAFDAVERVRARALRDVLTESRLAGREAVDSRLVVRERQLRDQLAREIEGQLRRPPGAVGAATQVARLETELRATEGEIRRLSPRYAGLVESRPATARELQESALDAETVLLAYAVGDDRSALWVVTRDALEMHPLPSRARLETMVRQTYASMTRPRSGGLDRSQRLARLLLGPAIPHLRSQLLVIADGALHYVPFAALPDPRGGMLIDRHEVVALPSASTIRLLRQSRASSPEATVRRTVAVLADPVFRPDDERITPSRQRPAAHSSLVPGDVTRAARDVDGLEQLSRLAFTRREATQIASLVKRSDSASVALDFEASLQTLREWRLGEYRFVHFATHGFLNTRRPELSGLILSLFDREGRPQEGFVSSLDAFNLDLSADVVVLSGCRTALGKEVRREGLAGLPQAFMYAGARSVVSSLWAVDDLATSALMTRFYEGLLAREPLRPSAALRAAQTYVRSRPQWRHPYYWAAFQIQGDWR